MGLWNDHGGLRSTHGGLWNTHGGRGNPSELVRQVVMAVDLDDPVTSLYFENEGGGMGKEIATDLAKELKVNRTLTHLSLADNSLGSAGETALADALSVNTTLVKLELQHIWLSKSGI